MRRKSNVVRKGLKIGLTNLDLAIGTFVYKNGRALGTRYLFGERGNHLVARSSKTVLRMWRVRGFKVFE